MHSATETSGASPDQSYRRSVPAIRNRRMAAVGIALSAAASVAFGQVAPPVAGGPTAPPAPASPLPSTVTYVLKGGAVVIKAGGAIGTGQEAVFDLSLVKCVVASDAGLSEPPAANPQVAVGTAVGPLTGRTFALRLVRIGTAAFTDVPAISADMAQHLSPAGAADLPRVWIGLGALGSPIVRLDPSRSELAFLPAAGIVGKVERVPVKQLAGRIGLEVTAGPAPSCSMVVSSTSSATVLPAGVVAALKLKPIEELAVAVPGARPGVARVYEVPELRIGKHKFTKVAAVTFIPPLPGLPAGVGVIGTDLLQRVKSTWVLAEGYVYMERLPDPK
ncbi:MAG: hypothetical protein NT029_19715 [Armatimonadetes bacterium]|nr:hypothetical protein [Armatimonadota bacterium]